MVHQGIPKAVQKAALALLGWQSKKLNVVCS
jgi:hypothetical protein